tara:strand:- start:3064 stop:3321 length:258 start_codon:yes stop_codon:yes gene_type:complete
METDITGYGRKMGLDAGGTQGRLNNVVTLQGERQIAGTVQYRTMNPSNSESAGGGANLGDYATANQSSWNETIGASGSPGYANPR